MKGNAPALEARLKLFDAWTTVYGPFLNKTPLALPDKVWEWKLVNGKVREKG